MIILTKFLFINLVKRDLDRGKKQNIEYRDDKGLRWEIKIFGRDHT